MNSLNQIKIKNRDIVNYISIFLFVSIPNLALSQKTSPQLDSIHQLEISDQEKTVRYHQLLASYEQKKEYTQLGSDAHQIAKWIVRKPGRKQEGISFVKKAIDARTKATPFDPKLLRTSYNNLGYYNFLSYNYNKSIKAYKKLLSIPNSNHFAGAAYHYMGKCRARLDDPATAIENYSKAFKLLLHKKNLLINNHMSISEAYKNMSNLKDAQKGIKHLQIADSLILSSNKVNKKKLYQVHNSIAGIYLESLHDTLKGLKHHGKALILAKEINTNYYISITHYNLGLANLSRDNKLALAYFNQSLLYADQDMHLAKNSYFGLGLTENERHNYIKSTSYYHQSLSNFFNKKITPENISTILTKKELSISNDKSLLIEVLREIIDNYIDHGKHTKENKHYQKAIETLQIVDTLIDIILESNASYDTKLLWRNRISSIYTSGIEACVANNQIAYGFYLSEKNKALLLMQEISQNKNNIPTTITEKTNKLEQEIIYLQDIYKTATSTKDSILNLILLEKNALEKHQDSIAIIYPDYSPTKMIPEILPLSDITFNLNEITIQYIMTEDIDGLFLDTYCLILSKDLKELYQLENTKKIHDKIYAIRKQLEVPFRSNKDIQEYKKKAHELYKSLIPKEIRPKLKNKKVTIITDHLLNTLPFEALISNIESGRYMIEDCEIRYTYSLSFEKQNAQKHRHAEKDFLGIAPVNFSDNLIKLNNSEKEIETANSYYPGTLLINKDASKENFTKQLHQYKIIHLATHANASDSIAPWIAFNDQKLIASELGLLKNQAEMIVLSACNTSLGEVRSGEGVLSLARGFFKSGAKSVMPSLWSTNDKATANITSNFYTNLSKGQTKSAALRNAKLTYLRTNTDAEASPHYWAPLILIGNNDIILPTPNYDWICCLIIGTLILTLLAWLLYQKKKNNRKNTL